MKYLVLLFFVSAAHATEVDNITSYYQPLADAEAALNVRTQELIAAGRARHFACNRRILARQMASQLIGNFIYGAVESFANTSPLVERAYTPTSESVYKGTPYQGGLIDSLVNLGPTVNVAGFRIGTDKLGHFMDMGYDLYQRSKMGYTVAQLLAQSRSEESGLWGALTTGVKSYGDIASNFDGYRFWTDLIDEGPRGFFVCENGSFKQVRAFKWSDYISAAWSEAINCNEYWSEAYTSHVGGNVRALETKSGRRYACPIAPDQCDILRNYYERWIPRAQISEIISPLCR
jgi:hypothetical protein